MSFFLPPDVRTFAVRYGTLALLNVFWTFFAVQTSPIAALAALLPLPDISILPFIPEAVIGTFTGEWGVGFLGKFLLDWSMFLLLLGGVRLAVIRFKPELLTNVPLVGLPKEDEGSLDGKRLRKPWWALPMTMVFLTIITTSLLVAIVGSVFTKAPPPYSLAMAGGWPLWVSLGLAAFGLLWGHRFNSSSLNDVSTHFGATFLDSEHWLTKRVHRLSDQLDLPRPKVGVVHEVNAFAIGSRPADAAVVLGVPLVKNLSQDELDAVIGHELGHIISNDMTQMNFAVGYQRMFGDMFSIIATMSAAMAASAVKTRSSKMLANSLGELTNMVGSSVLFVGGELATKGLSRRREFFADAVGAGLTSPTAMAGALSRLESIATARTPAEDRYAYLMFKGGVGRFAPFDTHPPMELRKKALEKGTYTRLMPRKGKS